MFRKFKILKSLYIFFDAYLKFFLIISFYLNKLKLLFFKLEFMFMQEFFHVLFKFSLAEARISLILFSWLTLVAPGS